MSHACSDVEQSELRTISDIFGWEEAQELQKLSAHGLVSIEDEGKKLRQDDGG